MVIGENIISLIVLKFFFVALFAIAVPQMASVLGFLTALSMTTMALFIPVVIDIMTKWYDDHDNLTSFYCRWIKNIFIGLVWLFMLVSVTNSFIICLFMCFPRP